MTVDHQYATRWREAAIQFEGIPKRMRKRVRDLAISGLQLFDVRRQDRFLRCLACHYVFDDQREQFTQIVADLKTRGKFVDTDTCLSMLEGRQEIEGPHFHLSFDDGFRNVITNALPILEAERIPAIMFVPSDLVGADWPRARDYAINVAKYRAAVEMASWDDLRQAVACGFEVGSHTRTHARLSTLSDDRVGLRRELADSKREIEDELGTACDYVAYPFGKPGDYDQTTLDTTREIGYRGGFGIHRGTIQADATDPMNIPRHHFEPEWPMSHIRYFANGNMEKYWSAKMREFGQTPK